MSHDCVSGNKMCIYIYMIGLSKKNETVECPNQMSPKNSRKRVSIYYSDLNIVIIIIRGKNPQ